MEYLKGVANNCADVIEIMGECRWTLEKGIACHLGSAYETMEESLQEIAKSLLIVGFYNDYVKGKDKESFLRDSQLLGSMLKNKALVSAEKVVMFLEDEGCVPEIWKGKFIFFTDSLVRDWNFGHLYLRNIKIFEAQVWSYGIGSNGDFWADNLKTIIGFAKLVKK